METHALILLEMDLAQLERVLKGELQLEDLDLNEDLRLLDLHLHMPSLKLIREHVEQAEKNKKNKLMFELEVKEIIRYLREVYHKIGYTIPPTGVKWTLKQMSAEAMIDELEKLKAEFSDHKNLANRMDLSTKVSGYQTKVEKIDPPLAVFIKEAADLLAEKKYDKGSVALLKCQRQLARFILTQSE